jgi:cupin fold WbuC family metalloprotein
MSLKQLSSAVFVAEGPIAIVGDAEIAQLEHAVHQSPLGRVRINLHPDGADALHEMFIAIRRDSYIRPHKHPGKSEAFHVVHGTVDIVVFEDDGAIRQVVPLGAEGPGRARYYRMSQPFFHTLVIRSELLVVHEITNGPFVPGGTLFGSFAPPDDDADGTVAFRDRLAKRVAEFTAVPPP